METVNKVTTFLSSGSNVLPDVYDVDAIVGHESDEETGYKYKVHWLGCPVEQDTWEPEGNISPWIIDDYWERVRMKEGEAVENRKDRDMGSWPAGKGFCVLIKQGVGVEANKKRKRRVAESSEDDDVCD